MDPRRTGGDSIESVQTKASFDRWNLGSVNERPTEGMFYAACFYLSTKRLSIAIVHTCERAGQFCPPPLSTILRMDGRPMIALLISEYY
jgi:hypothetical protein